MKEKSRALKGAKEARMNYKYMKTIEKPVSQVEKATSLKDILLVIVSLMRTLNEIFINSNFYKE